MATTTTPSDEGTLAGTQQFDFLFNLRRLRIDLEELQPKGPQVRPFAKRLEMLEETMLTRIVRERSDAERGGKVTVAVVGDFSSGKSTFINALLGANLCPVAVEPTTSCITTFVYGDKLVVEEEIRGGKRLAVSHADYEERVQHTRKNRQQTRREYSFHMRVPAPVLRNIRLVDTPGFGNPGNEAVDNARTEQAVAEADALLVIMDIAKGNPSRGLLDQLEKMRQIAAREKHAPAFLLVNQADKLPVRSSRQKIKERNASKYHDVFRRVELVSSLELSKAPDEPALAAMRMHVERAEAAVLARKPFQASLAGRFAATGGAAAFQVDVDGAPFQLPSHASDDLAGRGVLIQMLSEVAGERDALLKERAGRENKALRREWRQALHAVELWASSPQHRSPRAGRAPDLSAQIDQTLARVGEFVLEIYVDAIEGMFQRKKLVKKGFFSDDTFYRILVNAADLVKGANEDERWAEISRLLQSDATEIARAHGLSKRIDAGSIKSAGVVLVQRDLDSVHAQIRGELAMTGRGVFESQAYMMEVHWEDNRDQRDSVLAQIRADAGLRAAIWRDELVKNHLRPLLDPIRDKANEGLGRREADAVASAKDLESILKQVRALLENAP